MHIDHRLANTTPYLSAPVGYEHSWIELSQSALASNASLFKKKIGAHNRLAFVVKANAYGHGLEQICTMTEKIDAIDWLCTFSLSEALRARTYGSTKPILVLGYIDCDPTLAIGHAIEFMIDSLEQIDQLNRVGIQHGVTFNVHLKIDTGLSRFGINPEHALQTAQLITQSKGLVLNGIFTHLTESQEMESDFNHHQLALFNASVAQLHASNIYPRYVHTANTAGTLTQDLSLCNFFRVGLGLYGFFSSQTIGEYTIKQDSAFILQPILSWKTKIIHIKTVPAYAYISYNRTHQVQQETRIAIIPVGYSNGYDISLSNRADVLIHNVPAPVLGRVAMNITIIDITHIPAARLNDTVTLFGNHDSTRADTAMENMEIKNVRSLFTGLPSTIERTIHI